MKTSQRQNWRVKALLRGLGFAYAQEEDCDCFTIDGGEEWIHDGWEPREGAPALQWADLSNPESPNYQRRYLNVVKFRHGHHENVLVWSASPHDDDALYRLIALCSYQEWEEAGVEYCLMNYSVAL